MIAGKMFVCTDNREGGVIPQGAQRCKVDLPDIMPLAQLVHSEQWGQSMDQELATGLAGEADFPSSYLESATAGL